MGVIFIFSASKFLFVKGGLPYENVTKLWTLSKSLVLATTPGSYFLFIVKKGWIKSIYQKKE